MSGLLTQDTSFPRKSSMAFWFSPSVPAFPSENGGERREGGSQVWGPDPTPKPRKRRVRTLASGLPIGARGQEEKCYENTKKVSVQFYVMFRKCKKVHGVGDALPCRLHIIFVLHSFVVCAKRSTEAPAYYANY
jgi:hypothetical protein